jgi:hypothetical protein
MSVKPSKKAGSAAPGAKLLISVSAIAASLGGWAALAYKDQALVPSTVAASQPQVQVATEQPRPVAYLSVEFSTIPTLVPAPTLPKPDPTKKATKVAVIYVVPAATPQPLDPTGGLRVVNAPPPPPQNNGGGGQAQNNQSSNSPAPVTTTKSSQGG